MLTYHYALINDPCDRTAKTFLEFARAHPGCLLTLAPEDSLALHKALAAALTGRERECLAEDDDFMSAPEGRALQLEAVYN